MQEKLKLFENKIKTLSFVIYEQWNDLAQKKYQISQIHQQKNAGYRLITDILIFDG